MNSKDFFAQFIMIVMPKTLGERKIKSFGYLDYRIYATANIEHANPATGRNTQGKASGQTKREKITIPKSNIPKTRNRYKNTHGINQKH